jgi:hypothetical protein
MYADKMMYTQYGKSDMPAFKVEINSAHIRIMKGDKVVFDRTQPLNDETWYDEKHKQIVDALHELEAALDAAIG